MKAPKARNLNAATNYWKSLIERYEVVDIYTKKPLKDDISIDHFTPLEFILHDELWNLISTTRSVNSIKSDKLPNLEEYPEGFLELLYFAFSTSIEDKKVKVLEDFLNINGLKL